MTFKVIHNNFLLTHYGSIIPDIFKHYNTALFPPNLEILLSAIFPKSYPLSKVTYILTTSKKPSLTIPHRGIFSFSKFLEQLPSVPSQLTGLFALQVSKYYGSCKSLYKFLEDRFSHSGLMWCGTAIYMVRTLTFFEQIN